MDGRAIARDGVLKSLLIVGSILLLLFILTGSPGQAGCPPAEGSKRGVVEGRCVFAEDRDLICHPALLSATEGIWTFLIRGADAYRISGAELRVEGVSYEAVRLDYPTPAAALVDLAYPGLTPGSSAQLRLRFDDGGSESFAVEVVRSTEVARDRRQPNRVRVQLQPWTLVYPLHGFGSDRSIDGRKLEELAGEPEFLGLLTDLGVTLVRKVLSRYAEDDSVHWDESHNRELMYGGAQLRQYLLFIDEERSEEAYKEIFLGFPQVEAAFINRDSKRSG